MKVAHIKDGYIRNVSVMTEVPESSGDWTYMESSAARDAGYSVPVQQQPPRVYDGPTFQHAGRTFVITVETISKAALLAGRKGNGKNMTDKRFRDADGVVYQFVDNADFEAWLDAAELAYDTANGWL